MNSVLDTQNINWQESGVVGITANGVVTAMGFVFIFYMIYTAIKNTRIDFGILGKLENKLNIVVLTTFVPIGEPMINWGPIVASKWFWITLLVIIVYALWKTFRFYRILYKNDVLGKFMYNRIEYALFTWFNPMRATGLVVFVVGYWAYTGMTLALDWFIVALVAFYGVTGGWYLSTTEPTKARYKNLAIYQYAVITILILYLGLPQGALIDWIFGPPAQCMDLPSSPKAPVQSPKTLSERLIGTLYSTELPRHDTLARYVIDTNWKSAQTASKILVKDNPMAGTGVLAVTAYMVVHRGTAAICNQFGICTPYGPLSQMKKVAAALETNDPIKIISRKTATEKGFFKTKVVVEETIMEQMPKQTAEQLKSHLKDIAEMKGISNVSPKNWKLYVLGSAAEITRAAIAGKLVSESWGVAKSVVDKVDESSVSLESKAVKPKLPK